MERRSVRTLMVGITFVAILAVFFTMVRPWYLRWGASDLEVTMALPGDEIIPGARFQETRGITIDAGAELVWPWVAQIGQDRGGFYSFDVLENLVGCQMPTADHLRPDFQRWSLGDRLWMYPPDRAGGAGYATLRSYVPGRALAFGTHAIGTPIAAPHDGSWAFVVQPLDRYTTRLLFRGRTVARSWAWTLFDHTVFEPVHFVMERRTLIGIKQLAEAGDRHRSLNHLHVLLWITTFVFMIASEVQVIRRRAWQMPFAAFVAAAATFQFLTLAQPPLTIGFALVAALGTLLQPPSRWGIFHGGAKGSAARRVSQSA